MIPVGFMEQIFTELNELGCRIEQCGSQITCDPPPGEASDYDFLVQVPAGDRLAQRITDLVRRLTDLGFFWEGCEHYQTEIAGSFMSFRLADESQPKGGLNLIVTAHEWFAKRHRLATWVCKQLNLMVKEHRLTVFQAILYDNKWPELPPINAWPREPRHEIKLDDEGVF